MSFHGCCRRSSGIYLPELSAADPSGHQLIPLRGCDMATPLKMTPGVPSSA